MSKPKTAITPTREENYAEWYQQVIAGADLAETSPVRDYAHERIAGERAIRL